MGTGDIVIHIDEDLDDDDIHDLERAMAGEPGVVSACVHERTPHLLVVDFDPDTVRPSHLVESVRSKGLHASMLGL